MGMWSSLVKIVSSTATTITDVAETISDATNSLQTEVKVLSVKQKESAATRVASGIKQTQHDCFVEAFTIDADFDPELDKLDKTAQLKLKETFIAEANEEYGHYFK